MKLNWAKFLFFQEVAIIFLYLILLNNYFERKEVVIIADGKGYYDYLPATFIYHDLNFNYTDTLITEFYNHKEYNAGINPEINGWKVNKYFVGTALVQTPFFLTAHLIALNSYSYSADGYSSIYQDFVFYAALFYLFVGLYFLRKLLRLKGLQLAWIITLQLTVVFCTSIMHYAHAESSFSHIYSFAFITLFLYFFQKYSIKRRLKWFVLGCITLGIIILIRPINGLIIFTIPFLYENRNAFITDFKALFNKRLQTFLLGVVSCISVAFIQPMIWFIQTGQLYVKPYQDETFNFAEPHFIDFLFSFQKGFFIYAPVFLALVVFGIIGFIFKKDFWKIGTFILFFCLLVYVLSSWWMWFYGHTYGSRVMIDYYSVIILFGSSFFILKSNFFKVLFSMILLTFSYISIIQTYQYQNYILHWSLMNYERYWQTFLKTDEKYKGLLWIDKHDISDKKLVFNKKVTSPQKMLMEYNYLDSNQLEAFVPVYNFDTNYLVVVQLNVVYEKGEDEIVFILDDTLGNNKFYHGQHVFKGEGVEPYNGKTQLLFNIKGSFFNYSKMKLFYIKKEEGSEAKEFEINIYQL